PRRRQRLRSRLSNCETSNISNSTRRKRMPKWRKYPRSDLSWKTSKQQAQNQEKKATMWNLKTKRCMDHPTRPRILRLHRRQRSSASQSQVLNPPPHLSPAHKEPARVECTKAKLNSRPRDEHSRT